MADQPILPAEPWYTSKVYIGAIVAIVSQLAVVAPKVFAALGLTSPETIDAAVNHILETIGLLAAIYTATARAKSKVAPLTINAAGAAEHPNTIASTASPPPAKQPTI